MSAQRSDLVAYFTDYEERTAPLNGPAMRVTITADLAFIAIGTMVEAVGVDTFTSDDKLSIGVDVELLYNTLGAMLRRADRLHHDMAVEGELPADHPARDLAHASVVVAGTRRRA